VFKKNNEATFLLKGGLGNQLFQVAAGINYSITNGVAVKFDASWYHSNKEMKPVVEEFRVPLDAFHLWEIVDDLVTLDFKIVESKNRDVPLKFTEQQMSFVPLNARRGSFIYDGYWQSELFFREIKSYLGHYLRSSLPNPELISNNNIHIRRGDFLKAPFNEVHNSLGIDYYSRAINWIDSDAGYSWTAISQNRTELESEMLELLLKKQIKIQDGSSILQDMALLASSERLIIANSTFSWWGAYLSRAEEVVAPRNWFTKVHLRTKNVCDLYPEDWILI